MKPRRIVQDRVGEWIVSTVQLAEDLYSTSAFNELRQWKDLSYGRHFTLSEQMAWKTHAEMVRQITRDMTRMKEHRGPKRRAHAEREK